MKAANRSVHIRVSPDEPTSVDQFLYGVYVTSGDDVIAR